MTTMGNGAFSNFVHRNNAAFTTLLRGNSVSAAFSLKGAGEQEKSGKRAVARLPNEIKREETCKN
jgi:hypothetical protein